MKRVLWIALCVLWVGEVEAVILSTAEEAEVFVYVMPGERVQVYPSQLSGGKGELIVNGECWVQEKNKKGVEVRMAVDVNKATSNQLMQVKGMTVGMIEKIKEGRPYKHILEMQERVELDKKTFWEMRDCLEIGKEKEQNEKDTTH